MNENSRQTFDWECLLIYFVLSTYIILCVNSADNATLKPFSLRIFKMFPVKLNSLGFNLIESNKLNNVN